jgi:hypothetical protein
VRGVTTEAAGNTGVSSGTRASRQRPLTKSETAELAATIRRWLSAIAAEELEATPAMIQHLEGAELVLKAVLGEPFSLPGLQ